MTPKHPLLSKTNWFGLAVVLLGILELIQQHLQVLLVDVTAMTSSMITIGIGVAIITLRFITNGPVSWNANEHL